MAEYIVWVKQQGNSWERHDTGTEVLELAKLVRDQQRQTTHREVLITKLVLSDGPADVRAARQSAAPPSPATRETVAVNAAADPEPRAAAKPKTDREMQALSQLKEALENLDQQAVWRIAHWALEYARHTRGQ